MSGANNFDFLLGSWNILNKRKTGTSFWADHEPEEEAVLETANDVVMHTCKSKQTLVAYVSAQAEA
jgi:hypothetical protein